jgi:hypothetical protein
MQMYTFYLSPLVPRVSGLPKMRDKPPSKDNPSVYDIFQASVWIAPATKPKKIVYTASSTIESS